jgi:TRAP-type uncharacterized transport system substrate-binding protein
VGHPSANIQDPTTSCGAKLVSITGPAVDKLLAEKPYYSYATIPAASIRTTRRRRNLRRARDARGSSKTSPDTVYVVVKALFDNFDEFKKLHPASRT